jgi:hypothetical protein
MYDFSDDFLSIDRTYSSIYGCASYDIACTDIFETFNYITRQVKKCLLSREEAFTSHEHLRCGFASVGASRDNNMFKVKGLTI